MVTKTDKEWKEELSPETYRVMREKGTESPFANAFYKNFDDGMYHCASCGVELFSSKTKFDTDCGWPSFYDAVEGKNIETEEDTSHGMTRTEVHCKNCGGHLGHIFPDGPNPTGLRYCINSAALNFKKQ